MYAIVALSSEMLRNTALIDDRVYGGLAIYLLTALLFASIHRHISALDQAAYSTPLAGDAVRFSWDQSLYFSLSTITTVGYGDIFPKSTWARSACVTESVTGVFLSIVFIARLAALPTPQRKHEQH